MWARPPSGREKWASMARSTPGEESLASALITRGPGGQEPQQAHGVAAHVHGGAAGQGQLVADVALLPQGSRERDVDVGDVAELARADDLHQALGEGVVLVVEGLHDHQAGVGVVHLRHRPGLVGVGGERLLAQDVLAGLEGRDGPVAVQPVGERVVDGVDVGIAHQFGVIVQDAGDLVLAGELLGPGTGRGPPRRRRRRDRSGGPA